MKGSAHTRVHRPLTSGLRRALAGCVLAGAVAMAAMGASAGTAHALGLPCSSGFIDHAVWQEDPQQLDVLVVTPSACGRGLGLLAVSTPAPVYDLALAEAEAKAGRGSPNQASLRDQLGCHATFAPSKPVWDLEPARPDNGPAGMIFARCNPLPVWVGQPAGNQQAYEDAFSRGGRIWGMGLASGPVHPWGPGCIQDFAGGSRGAAAIMSPNCTGPAYWVGDQFWGYFAGNFPGTAATVIGYPYNESHRWGPGWVQDFSGGWRGVNMLMQADGQSAVHEVFGAIRAKYIALGGAPGFLGFPTSDEHSWGGVTRQDFAGGSILWDAYNGARLLAAVGTGAPNPQSFVDAFNRGGGAGAMGQPLDVVHSWGPGCIQDFNGGTRGKSAIMSPGCRGAAYWVGDLFWAYYEGSYGSAASTVVGYPYNESHRWGGGWAQDFTGGQFADNILLRGDGQAGAHEVHGAIRAEYISLGGAPGRLGFPLDDEHQANGVTRQDYAGGSLVWDPTYGARQIMPTQQLVFFDNLGTVNSILVHGANQNGAVVNACVQTPGHTTIESNWWWAARTLVYTYGSTNCTGGHPTGTLWIDPDGATPYRCLIDNAPYSDWSCKP